MVVSNPGCRRHRQQVRDPQHPHSIAAVSYGPNVDKLPPEILPLACPDPHMIYLPVAFLRLRHHNKPATMTATMAIAILNRSRLRSNRAQCCPNRYPAAEITETHRAAPKKLNTTNFRHGIRNTPAMGPAMIRSPTTKRAKNTVTAP